VNYKVAGKLTVVARSSVHDTTTVWDRVTGEVVADPAAMDGATASFAIDMARFDAGDFLKNRKLRKDYAMDDHADATFTLARVKDLVRDGDKFTATGEGTLRWRGKELVLEVAGRGTLDTAWVTATATFELDIKRLGLEAPKLLMFKVDDVVAVEVSVRGQAQSP
jgi:polyisoprenoid-binding protein YceI